MLNLKLPSMSNFKLPPRIVLPVLPRNTRNTNVEQLAAKKTFTIYPQEDKTLVGVDGSEIFNGFLTVGSKNTNTWAIVLNFMYRDFTLVPTPITRATLRLYTQKASEPSALSAFYYRYYGPDGWSGTIKFLELGGGKGSVAIDITDIYSMLQSLAYWATLQIYSYVQTPGNWKRNYRSTRNSRGVGLPRIIIKA